MKLWLYSTSACHLCDQAEAMLHGIAAHINLSWSTVDIVDDDALMQRYGLKIPVLHRADVQTELCWPFTEADILHWLAYTSETQ